jgi:ectoine hydroxylase-related dioxygenase (phytanoyl-CoA dioxygenase family)
MNDSAIDELDAPFPLALSEVEKFRQDGYVRLSAVLSPETLDRFGKAITDATLRLNTDHRPLAERNTYDRAFLQITNLWRADDSAHRFVFGKRLAQIAAALLGVRAVRLYHDQSLYKEPGGGITPAHADQYYWPLSSDRTVTAWIPLQAVPDEMGPLAFYRASHQVDFGRDLPISDESEKQITAALDARGFAVEAAPYALGDVSFHGGWTFHRAGENRTTRPRSVMTVIYMDADMRVSEPTNDFQRNDLARWLPGLKPGDPAASAINPILFEKT